MAKKKGLHITDGLNFICPFCKAKCTVSREKVCVLHEMPMCETYERLEPDEFLAAVNKKIAERKAN